MHLCEQNVEVLNFFSPGGITCRRLVDITDPTFRKAACMGRGVVVNIMFRPELSCIPEMQQ